jgi:hypothetical protein
LTAPPATATSTVAPIRPANQHHRGSGVATKAGRKALEEEIAALREIIGSVDGQSAVGGLPGSAPLAGS